MKISLPRHVCGHAEMPLFRVAYASEMGPQYQINGCVLSVKQRCSIDFIYSAVILKD
jgi:hypothetical protein